MTTVAFKDGVMAADSRCTDDHGMHLTDCKKIFRLPSGGVLGQAGDDDIREVLSLVGKAKTGRGLPSKYDIADTHTSCCIIIVLPNRTLWQLTSGRIAEDHDAGWYASFVELNHPFAAVGSGQQFAYGAMRAGCSAEEAVKIACHFDIYSNPPIQLLEIPGWKRRK